MVLSVGNFLHEKSNVGSPTVNAGWETFSAVGSRFCAHLIERQKPDKAADLETYLRLS